MWNCGILLCAFFSVSYACQGRTCSACITSAGNCAWCSKPDYGDPDERCNTYDKHMQAGCPEANITFPNSTVTYIENKNVTDGGAGGKGSVQVQPQNITIKIRPNAKVTVPFTFRAARNYPVDLYFLFDLSNTMKKHKEKLANLAKELGSEIGKISRNFRLGFGYFQDKVILPFTNTVPAQLANPCSMQAIPCSSPFGYRHRLNLTRNIDSFEKSVQSANVTGNIDVPEGGLDAIMQVVVCQDEIGWRKDGRRLLIYSSDSTFHLAGDGRLAGIVRPNDGQCHLDDQGKNVEELNQDYPSVGQISYKVEQQHVNIIFAIAKNSAKYDYQQLSERISGSSVSVLQSNSENVVKIVKDKYEEIISEVELKVDAPPDVLVELKSDCETGSKKKTNKCTGLKIGKQVTFDVEILATECPADPNERKVVTVSPLGLPDTMSITLDLICECDCEKQDQEEADSPLCSAGNGTYECGICSCNPGRFGKECECSNTDLSSSGSNKCKSENSTVDCLGRGRCECGECVCSKGYSGRFCECHENACDKYNGLACGGPGRGRCNCGNCRCNEGYSGSRCECDLSQDACLDANGGICNNHGSCACGRCNCTGAYVGSLCETCPICPGECANSRKCAECVGFKTGALTEEQCEQQCGHVMKVDFISEEDTCRVKDVDGCTIVFRIIYHDKDNTTVEVQENKECPKPVDILPIVAGVIGGILAVGLLLLILWKILTSLYDGIEYARFREEIENPKWGQVRNPIFKDPTTTFNNPNFEKSEPLLE